MLDTFTSLEDTAVRFDQSPGFIWNLSLIFQEFLLPKLGANGLIEYSCRQRSLIADILRWRASGFSDQEISDFIREASKDLIQLQDWEAQKKAAPDSNSATTCRNILVCKKNMSILASQVQFLWQQLCKLQIEFTQISADFLIVSPETLIFPDDQQAA